MTRGKELFGLTEEDFLSAQQECIKRQPHTLPKH